MEAEGSCAARVPQRRFALGKPQQFSPAARKSRYLKCAASWLASPQQRKNPRLACANRGFLLQTYVTR